MNMYDINLMSFFSSLFVGVILSIASGMMYRISKKTEKDQIKIKYDIGKIMSVELENKKEKRDDEKN